MKYFTKYLPVPGEIKEGDNFLYDLNSSLLGSNYRKKNDPWFPEPVAAKMFLCSRDIQVGDMLTCINPESINYIEESITDIQPDWIDKENWVKVIGEVSPAAIWVKEGMEFDESELNHDGWFDEELKRTMVTFKRPTCNTFH